jgi:NAD(P)-dependent dehydrogenase (short-subunit alcohol dehydrogenase family)
MVKKYAIVTGASSGVEGAIALELAKHNYFIALVGRSQQRLDHLNSQIEKIGGQSKIFVSDLSTKGGIRNLIQAIKSDAKQVDILVNAAAIWHGEDEVYAGRNYDTFSEQVILDTMTVGLMAPMLLTHALIPLMPPKSKIINISGTFEDGGKGWVPYFVSKRGIEDLTIGLSDELKERNIQVNAISPSDTATEQYKKYFPQFAASSLEPQAIAEQVVRLCSETSDRITGQVFVMKKGEPTTSQFHA